MTQQRHPCTHLSKTQVCTSRMYGHSRSEFRDCALSTSDAVQDIFDVGGDWIVGRRGVHMGVSVALLEHEHLRRAYSMVLRCSLQFAVTITHGCGNSVPEYPLSALACSHPAPLVFRPACRYPAVRWFSTAWLCRSGSQQRLLGSGTE